ncbi:DUF7344 domain-containing protein [Haloplanus halophilus]|uniref:DUF7344 domain-containing protein n=1 Tax=Haloplanus halophilus TaxID=2949993 RepID=UPI00204252F0|nr:hypothetical protein [Haloplanus sp. GDY1]
MDQSRSPRPAERAFAVLRHPRRIDVLHVLQRADRPLSVDVLARSLDGEDVAVSLHHTHLPHLDDAGIVEYDPADRELTDVDAERLDALLRAADSVVSSLRAERIDEA